MNHPARRPIRSGPAGGALSGPRPGADAPGVQSEIRDRVLKIDRFADAMKSLCACREMDPLKQTILDGLVDGLGFERAALWTLNPRHSHLWFVGSRGGRKPLPQSIPLHGPGQDPTLTWVIKNGRQVTYPVDPLPAPLFFRNAGDRPASYALLPFRHPDQRRRRRFRDRTGRTRAGPPCGILLVEPMHFVGQLLLDAFLRTAEIVAENISRSHHLEDLSRRDGLTGLWNRQEMMNRLRKLAWAARHGAEVGLLFIDLDHFKRVNDTLGHEAGDKVLQSVARTIDRSIREEDMLGRIGGEELLVVVPRTDPKRLGAVARRICRIVSRIDFSSLTPGLAVTLSIGGALFPSQARTCRKLLKLADEALYEAKERGRNQVVIHRQRAG